MLGHGDDVRLLLPEHHEPLQPVHQAGQPHGVALIDEQCLWCGGEGGWDDLPGLFPRPGLVTHVVVQLSVRLAVGGGRGGTWDIRELGYDLVNNVASLRTSSLLSLATLMLKETLSFFRRHPSL